MLVHHELDDSTERKMRFVCQGWLLGAILLFYVGRWIHKRLHIAAEISEERQEVKTSLDKARKRLSSLDSKIAVLNTRIDPEMLSDTSNYKAAVSLNSDWRLSVGFIILRGI